MKNMINMIYLKKIQRLNLNIQLHIKKKFIVILNDLKINFGEYLSYVVTFYFFNSKIIYKYIIIGEKM